MLILQQTTLANWLIYDTYNVYNALIYTQSWLIVQPMVFANYRIHCGLWVVFVCLQTTPSHYHHYADLSEGIELLKCLSGICCRVCG